MSRNPLETVMGAVVLLVAGFFLVFAYQNADLKPVVGYNVKARFLKAGGLEVGSDVRISGIKVGTVVGQNLDLEDFTAVMEMSIKPDVKLPKDTIAVIASDGLMGGMFLKLEPGTDKEMINPGEEIAKTKDYKSLEDSVSDIIFLATQ